jgi:hypothetical protein
MIKNLLFGLILSMRRCSSMTIENGKEDEIPATNIPEITPRIIPEAAPVNIPEIYPPETPEIPAIPQTPEIPGGNSLNEF